MAPTLNHLTIFRDILLFPEFINLIKRLEERRSADADKSIEGKESADGSDGAAAVERAMVSDGSEGPVVEVIRKKIPSSEEKAPRVAAGIQEEA